MYSCQNYKHVNDIFGLFAGQVKRVPSKIAVTCNGYSLTYIELYNKVILFATHLKEVGLGIGDIICVATGNSLESIVSILAIQKIGAICLPIDIRYPVERIEYILKDSNAKAILLTNSYKFYTSYPINKIHVDLNRMAPVKMNNNVTSDETSELSYCIYTSGSTGYPKGVLLYSRGILNHVQGKVMDIGINENDIICQSLSISFVASIWQVLTPLIIGAKLIVYKENIISNVYKMFKKAVEDRVSFLSVTPSILDTYLSLIGSGKRKLPLEILKGIVITGEMVTPSLVNTFYREYKIPLINAYGQTECSDDTLHYKIPYSVQTEVIPIGKPIINTEILILDDNLKQVNEGSIGELYISGIGLAKGYINKPDLTSERFIENPSIPHMKMYKTGDIVRRLLDGNLEYIGRKDNQVKIRGYRIELEEIEQIMCKFSRLKQVIVLAVKGINNEAILCACYVADEEISHQMFREYLIDAVPEYMIPAYYIRVEDIPQMPNGKADRGLLYSKVNQVIAKGKMVSSDISQPSEFNRLNSIQRKVEEIVRKHLAIPLDNCKIEIDDDLKKFGMDSVTFVKVVLDLEIEFNFEFDDLDLDYNKFKDVQAFIKYINNNALSSNLYISS